VARAKETQSYRSEEDRDAGRSRVSSGTPAMDHGQAGIDLAKLALSHAGMRRRCEESVHAEMLATDRRRRMRNWPRSPATRT
jgi:hypothetical protein